MCIRDRLKGRARLFILILIKAILIVFAAVMFYQSIALCQIQLKSGPVSYTHLDGFSLFLRTIPFNLYAILTIIFMLFIILGGFDFAAMKKYNERVEREGKEKTIDAEAVTIAGNGKVIDLVAPIIILIVFCISGMLYTGGIMEGVGIVEAFANCDSALSLVLGSFFTLVFIFIFYLSLIHI